MAHECYPQTLTSNDNVTSALLHFCSVFPGSLHRSPGKMWFAFNNKIFQNEHRALFELQLLLEQCLFCQEWCDF